MQTQKKGALLKSALMLGALAFLLAGCGDTGRRTGKTKSPTPAAASPAASLPTSIQNIAYVTFNLPEQVQWEVNKDPQLEKEGKMEWIVKGTTPESTPARVMYQKLASYSPSKLKGDVTSSLRSCADSKVTDLRGTSQYRNYITFETICSKLGKNKYGLIDYLSIFSDGEASHVVMAEIKTPPSKKAGVLDAKTAQAQKQAETAKVLAELLNKTIQSVRACDANQRCI